MIEPDANGWMPIGTAPKDGRLILVANRLMNEHQGCFVVYFSYEWEEWKFHVEGVVRNPTHWQHLPKPPVANPVHTGSKS